MPRVVDHEERRWEITHAVWHLIATRGFEAVTLRSVAAEAGISVGRIQHYFSSKEEMVRHGCRAMVVAAAESFGQATSDTDPVEALKVLVTHSIPGTDAGRIGTTVWYAYLARSVDDPEISAILRDAKRGEQEEGVRLLQAVQQTGQASEDLDAGFSVGKLLSMADGLAVRVLIGQLSASEAVGVLHRELESVLKLL